MESDLLREIKDIRDDLHIIKVICEDQHQALSEWANSTTMDPPLYSRKVGAMEKQALATYNAVCLRFKFASIASILPLPMLMLVAQ